MYMMPRVQRWMATLIAGGCLLQTGACTLDSETSAAIAQEVLSPQIANLIADTVFFLLDNALVRLTA